MLIQSRPALDPELAALVTAQQREIRDTAAFAPDDDVAYLVAVVDGRAVGCGAWRAIGVRIGEHIGTPAGICFEKRLAALVQ